MRENHVKNYKPRGGAKVRSILHSNGLLNSCQIVQWDPQNLKRTFPQKKFGMGYVKMHGFYVNPLYDSQDLGGRPTNSIISRLLLIPEH